MSFAPYHLFRNGKRIEQVISSLRDSSSISDIAYAGFHRYHPALMHKLRSAKYNLDRLEDKLATTDIQEAADATGDFMFEVNMFIDGFLYSCGSAMDILARVVLVLFEEAPRDRVYFETAYETLSTSRPGDSILHRLDPPVWRREFTTYRNASTHELIVATSYRIHIENVEGQMIHTIVFPMPDDPRAVPSQRSYDRNPNALEYLKRTFIRELRLIHTIYGDIVQKAHNTGRLPL